MTPEDGADDRADPAAVDDSDDRADPAAVDDSDDRADPTAPDDPEPDGAATTIGGNATDDGDDREWKFGIDDVSPDGVTEDTATPEDEPIEPGDVTLEHAVFVALGVAITVGTFVFGF